MGSGILLVYLPKCHNQEDNSRPACSLRGWQTRIVYLEKWFLDVGTLYNLVNFLEVGVQTLKL